MSLSDLLVSGLCVSTALVPSVVSLSLGCVSLSGLLVSGLCVSQWSPCLWAVRLCRSVRGDDGQVGVLGECSAVWLMDFADAIGMFISFSQYHDSAGT